MPKELPSSRTHAIIFPKEVCICLLFPPSGNVLPPICKRYGIEKAYLFGSYSRNDANENSDVDLHIEPGSIDDLFTLSGFRLDIMDALGTEVDVISEMPESPMFQENLKHDEVLLYEA